MERWIDKRGDESKRDKERREAERETEAERPHEYLTGVHHERQTSCLTGSLIALLAAR